MQPCPLCARGNFDEAKVCRSCGISITDDLTELDPAMREMWSSHARHLAAIRKGVWTLVAVVAVILALSVVGSIIWLAQSDDTSSTGF